MNANCPRCGTALAADSPQSLCPRCLMAAALASETDQDTTVHKTPPSPAELQPLFPAFEILELLGKGGMGAVYKARQIALDRIVAIKILPPRTDDGAAFAERFSREAKALARLSHTNIVGVHDFGEAGGLFYFAMEYVDGVNLRQAMRAGQLGPTEALKIVPQICEALQYAHDEGIVHRDVKPENILIDKRGRVKIADFGLAKILGADVDTSLTGTRQGMGTLHYMAPEQLEGAKGVDHRADIYSLGVTFYEMLTGELPIGRFAPPSTKVQIDVRFDEVVLRSLEKEPEKRYQHASDVKTEVETISKTPADPSATSLDNDVADVFRIQGKIAAIKLHRKRTGLGLKESKDAVERLAAKRGLESPTEDVGPWFYLMFLIPLAIAGQRQAFRLAVNPAIWVAGMFLGFTVFLSVRIWRNRDNAKGTVAGLALGIFLAGYCSMAFGNLDDWLPHAYELLGREPGEHDRSLVNGVFAVSVLAGLGLLFWSAYRLWWSPLPGSTESRGWMGLPLGVRWLIKAVFTIACLALFVVFANFQFQATGGANQKATQSVRIGIPEPWFLSETRPNGFHQSINFFTWSFGAGVLGGVLFWLLLVAERIERRARHPNVMEGVVAEAREIAGYQLAAGIGGLIVAGIFAALAVYSNLQSGRAADGPSLLTLATITLSAMAGMSLLVSLLMIAASVCLARLKSPGFVRFTAVMALIPSNPVWLFSLPVGIWVLRFLNRPEAVALTEAAASEIQPRPVPVSVPNGPGFMFAIGWLIGLPIRHRTGSLIAIAILGAVLCLPDWFVGDCQYPGGSLSFASDGMMYPMGWAVFGLWVALAFFLISTFPWPNASILRGAVTAALACAAGILVIVILNERPVPNHPANATIVASLTGFGRFADVTDASDREIVRQGVAARIVLMRTYPTPVPSFQIVLAIAGVLLAAIEIQQAIGRLDRR